MEFLTNLPVWLNDTAVKSVLLFLGGVALVRWRPFVNKAVPTALVFISAIVSSLQAIGSILGGVVPSGVPADPSAFTAVQMAGVQFSAAASTGSKAASWFWNTLAPVAFAVAAHSAPKNTAQWISMGARLLWPSGGPPTR